MKSKFEKITKMCKEGKTTKFIKKEIGITKEELDDIFLEIENCTFQEYKSRLYYIENKDYISLINKTKKHIQENCFTYGYKIRITIKYLDINETRLNYIWKKFYPDECIEKYVHRLKIEKARELLKKGYTSNEVAKKVGVKNTKNYPFFSRYFKKHSGESVTKWLEKYNIRKKVEKEWEK